MEVVPAFRTQRDDAIYLIKECPTHGRLEALLWRDAELYDAWAEGSEHAARVVPNSGSTPTCPYDCGLCAEHEGGSCTAVFHLTDDCNLTCPVCFARAGTKPDQTRPTLDDIRSMYAVHLTQGPGPSIQLSGGEVTLREDLPDIIRLGKDMDAAHIQVNTNGLRLAEDPSLALRLKEAGADLIYLQFDGVSEEVYLRLRGRALLDIKLKALYHCREAGIGVLLVPTVFPGVNDLQLGAMVSLAKQWMPVVKGIHFQPVSYFGRFPGDAPSDEDRITLPDVIKALEAQTDGEVSLSAVVPRRRFDAHCAFSSVFVLDEQGQLHPTTRWDRTPVALPASRGPEYYPDKANTFTNKFWRMGPECSSQGECKPLSALAQRLRHYTLSITGMHFQDIWNLDLSRLKGCCVHVTTPEGRRIPLCAYYLTSANGRRLYGQKEKRMDADPA